MLVIELFDRWGLYSGVAHESDTGEGQSETTTQTDIRIFQQPDGCCCVPVTFVCDRR